MFGQPEGQGGNEGRSDATRPLNSAAIVVTLPADAQLTIDGASTTSTSGKRVYWAPPLQRGVEFHYVFKVSVVRQNETVTESKVIAVRADGTTNIHFEEPGVAVARR